MFFLLLLLAIVIFRILGRGRVGAAGNLTFDLLASSLRRDNALQIKAFAEPAFGELTFMKSMYAFGPEYVSFFCAISYSCSSGSEEAASSGMTSTVWAYPAATLHTLWPSRSSTLRGFVLLFGTPFFSSGSP